MRGEETDITPDNSNEWETFKKQTALAVGTFLGWLTVNIFFIMSMGIETAMDSRFMLVTFGVGVICFTVTAYNAYHVWKNIRRVQ